MKKTKIEWCDSTWNPVTGCRHGCEYCYARRIAERFGGWYNAHAGNNALLSPCEEPAVINKPMQVKRRNGKLVQAPFPFEFAPTFHRYRLEEPQGIKTPQNIFVCSMADLFGEWVPDEWIEQIFAACEKAPQHRYLFLTKNPKRYGRLAGSGKLPQRKNFWYGATATDHLTMTDTMRCLPSVGRYNLFLSVEPMLGNINLFAAEQFPKWIIFGAMTGPDRKKYKPNQEWKKSLLETPVQVFMKDSLIPIIGEKNMRREFPW